MSQNYYNTGEELIILEHSGDLFLVQNKTTNIFNLFKKNYIKNRPIESNDFSYGTYTGNHRIISQNNNKDPQEILCENIIINDDISKNQVKRLYKFCQEYLINNKKAILLNALNEAKTFFSEIINNSALKKSQGYFGELVFLKECLDLNIKLENYNFHIKDNERFDFKFSYYNLEVKCAISKYEFFISSNQLVKQEKPLVICLVKLEIDDAGINLFDLIDKLLKHRNTTEYLNFNINKINKYMKKYQNKIKNQRFNKRYDLRIFHEIDIPKIPDLLLNDDRIKSVKLNVQMANMPWVSVKELFSK